MITRRTFLKNLFGSIFFSKHLVKSNFLENFNIYSICGVYPLSGKYSYIGAKIKDVIDFTNFLIKTQHPLIVDFFGKKIDFTIASSFIDDKSKDYLNLFLGEKLSKENCIFIHGSYASELTFKLKYSCFLARVPLVNFISTASRLTSNFNDYFARTCANNRKILEKLVYDFLPKHFNGNFALLHAPNIYGYDILYILQNLLKANSLKNYFVFYQPVSSNTNFYNTIKFLKQKKVKTLILAIYLPAYKDLLEAMRDLDYDPLIITLVYARKSLLKNYKGFLENIKIFYVDHRGEKLKQKFLEINEVFKKKTSLNLNTNLARIFQGYLIALYPLMLGAKDRKSYIKILKNIYIPKEKLFLDWDDVRFINADNIGAKIEFKLW